ncbi:thermonuclease family protein [Candidatus Saccharibacteria bacterium]|nr:thermonuclease family protein [Candidatus Saccharibacteria bacterium]
MKKIVKALGLVVVGTLLIYGAYVQFRVNTSKTSGQANTYQVKKVVDGDTIEVVINGKTETVRLIGMDTPEVVDPRKPVQCFGREASAKGHELMDGKSVRLESDTLAGEVDKYNRRLAYVWLPDGSLYNQYMIAEGFAHEYTYQSQPYKYQAQFKAAQALAKSEQKGFWSPNTCDGDTKKAAS